MAQGEAISVLVRAYLMNKDRAYLQAARSAFRLMVAPMGEGGCAEYRDGGIFLEEYPENPRNSVLNGWIFAIFGVHDLSLASEDEQVGNVLAGTLETLVHSLPSYDMGYWTYYDLRGHIASPFYHSLHIAQLKALHLLTGAETFRRVADNWGAYETGSVNKTRAVTIKLWQKFRDPIKTRSR